jgi:hypothetical protein
MPGLEIRWALQSPNAGRALSPLERMHARTRTWMKCVYSVRVRAAASEVVVFRKRPTGRWVDGEIVKNGTVAIEWQPTCNLRLVAPERALATFGRRCVGVEQQPSSGLSEVGTLHLRYVSTASR